MDELSPLFQEIEFHERYRGYDPDEVDAFVDRVARAAAAMRGRIAELHERVDAAEARGAGLGAPTDTGETLTRTLVLAQRTADAAIADARQEADRLTADAAAGAQAILAAAEAEAAATLKDAEDRAGLILAEAETDRRTMVAEAEAVASEAAGLERERLAAEVVELQEYRAFLADDIAILERHLNEERHQLTVSLSALTDLLESPEAFRASRPPATSGVEIAPELVEAIVSDVPIEGVEQPEVTSADAELVEPEVAESEIVESEIVESEVVESELVDAECVGPVDDATVESAADVDDLPWAPVFEPADQPSDETIDLVEAESAEQAQESPIERIDHDEIVYTEIRLADPEADDVSDGGPGGGAGDIDHERITAPAFAGMVESSIEAAVANPGPPLVTAADLEAASGRLGFESSSVDTVVDDGGPATQAVPALQDGSLFADPETADDPFLAQLRDAVDADPVPLGDDDALSAFFDQEDDDGGRSWFGRRR